MMAWEYTCTSDKQINADTWIVINIQHYIGVEEISIVYLNTIFAISGETETL